MLIWIDADEAVIVRWLAGAPSIARIRSDVPRRRRATGHVRHDPRIRHGGGGRPQSAAQPRRLEHLRQFVEQVADRVQPEEDVLLIGPGSVRKRLEGLLRAGSATRKPRTIRCEPAERLTDPQLVALVREFVDSGPERRVVGAGHPG